MSIIVEIQVKYLTSSVARCSRSDVCYSVGVIVDENGLKRVKMKKSGIIWMKMDDGG